MEVLTVLSPLPVRRLVEAVMPEPSKPAPVLLPTITTVPVPLML